MTAEHRINWVIRRSLAERCYLEWKAAPADDAASREIYSVHCSCDATGAINRLRHHSTIRVISWTPDAIALRDRAACPAVAKALADEFPSALEAQTIESLPVAEQQRLAAEYRQTLVEEAARAAADPPPINCDACANTGYADYAAVPCEACRGAAYRGPRGKKD